MHIKLKQLCCARMLLALCGSVSASNNIGYMLHMCDVGRLTGALCVFAHASDLNLNKFACSWTSLSSSISFGAALLLRNVESWGARWYHIRCYFPTDSWLGRRWGAVVSTTKCSEQNHKFKEKELRGHPNSKIQNQDLLLWSRFQNRHHVRAGFAAY